MLLRPSSINQITFSPLGGLYAYLLSLPNQVIFIPLLDPVGTTNPRVYNPALAKGRNLLLNPTFASDTNWIKGTGWTISGGAGNKAAGSAAGIVQTMPISTGTTYEVLIEILNYVAGTLTPTMGVSSVAGLTADGSYSQNILYAAGVAQMNFSANALFDGSIDNASLKQLNIPANSMTATATGALARGEYWEFDGNADRINIYSQNLNSSLYLDEVTVNIFAYHANPADTTLRRVIILSSQSGNNIIGIHYFFGSLIFTAALNGVISSVTVAASAIVGNWSMLTITVSLIAGEMKAYINGAQVGTTQAIANAQTENLNTTSAVIGATSSAGAQSWLGRLRLAQAVNGALTPAEIANIYALSG